MPKKKKKQNDYDDYDNDFADYDDNNYSESDDGLGINSDTESSSISQDDKSYAIGKFFDVTDYLYEKEMNYKGFTKKGKFYVKTGDPIAPDLFIDSIISTYRSVLSQHSTISFLTDDEANNLLLENFNACMQTIVDEKFFDWDRFQLFKEDFDHTLQLFVGLIRRGRGADVAMHLQAGMVSETLNNSNNKNKGFINEALDYINNKK